MNLRNVAKVVSLDCDTVPSNSESTNGYPPVIEEVEIPTAASRIRASRMSGRFLKGPIAMSAISKASRLGGRTLALYLAIHHQTALTRKSSVTVPKGLLADLGIDKDAKARALRSLEEAELVIVDRKIGTAPRVSLAIGHKP